MENALPIPSQVSDSESEAGVTEQSAAPATMDPKGVTSTAGAEDGDRSEGEGTMMDLQDDDFGQTLSEAFAHLDADMTLDPHHGRAFMVDEVCPFSVYLCSWRAKTTAEVIPVPNYRCHRLNKCLLWNITYF